MVTCRVCENAAFLCGTDTLANIARRLGYGVDASTSKAREYLLHHLRRHRQTELAERLSRIEQGVKA